MKTFHALVTICIGLMLAPLANAQKYHAFIWNSGSGSLTWAPWAATEVYASA
jgi:hypothetical protein